MISILVVQSGPQLANAGDIAMLQAGLQQLSRLWSDSASAVLADDPVRLAVYCPQAQWVPMRGCMLWSSPLVERVARRAPTSLSGMYDAFERFARYRVAAMGNRLLRRRASLMQDGETYLESFRNAMLQADIVVATGGGYLNDEFPLHAHNVLRCLEWAIRANKPTFMVGQGIGPLTDAGVRKAAQSVLPRINLIALREQLTSEPLLQALGVPAAAIHVTGDDVVELAYNQRPHDLGDAIGINLRRARYAPVTPAQLAAVGSAVRAVAGMLQAPLTSIPMASLARDQAAIAEFLQIVAPIETDEASDDPLVAIARIGACRVVVAGSYHAGVFALSQGIPVVCLVSSPYYAHKFHGLAAQFGSGCIVLDLNDARLAQKLTDALLTGWRTADDMRPGLLSAARRQIEAGRQAYRRLAVLADMNGRVSHP